MMKDPLLISLQHFDCMLHCSFAFTDFFLLINSFFHTNHFLQPSLPMLLSFSQLLQYCVYFDCEHFLLIEWKKMQNSYASSSLSVVPSVTCKTISTTLFEHIGKVICSMKSTSQAVCETYSKEIWFEKQFQEQNCSDYFGQWLFIDYFSGLRMTDYLYLLCYLQGTYFLILSSFSFSCHPYFQA